ncbi:MAG: hypothetical protein ACRC9N_00380, partial [Aeromonas sp.]
EVTNASLIEQVIDKYELVFISRSFEFDRDLIKEDIKYLKNAEQVADYLEWDLNRLTKKLEKDDKDKGSDFEM